MKYEELSDRELDVLVAEKVMGFKFHPERERNNDLYAFYAPAEDAWTSLSPTTEAIDRDQVVEKMRELKLYYNVQGYPDRYEVSFNTFLQGHIDWVPCQSIGRGTCIAALKALEAK